MQDEPDIQGPDEPPSSHVDLISHTDINTDAVEGWLEQQVCRAIELCGIRQAQLNLVIVADEEMAQLHEQYTGVCGTTDVLTFNMADRAEDVSPTESDQTPSTIEADLILCIDEARRQAQLRDHQPREELLLYAIHGLMHLLGEDDHGEEAFERMHSREDALLQQMGFGPLFDPDRKSTT